MEPQLRNLNKWFRESWVWWTYLHDFLTSCGNGLFVKMISGSHLVLSSLQAVAQGRVWGGQG